jgi:glycosyltransferase involved in cell wall biosynthesis
MRILQVSTGDIGGGAEKIAHDLFSGTRMRGHDSWLTVGEKFGKEPNVFEIPARYQFGSEYARALMRARHKLRSLDKKLQPYGRLLGGLIYWLAHPAERFQIWRGRENFIFPGSHQILDLISERADLIHAHNLHGYYFDLRFLIKLSHRVPLLLTLHDEWVYTGHCASTLGCRRWELGCGSCPDLKIYPEINRDSTAYNWKRKRDIYQQSRLYVTTPSHWLMERVGRSMFNPQNTQVIHNSVNLEIFKPPQNLQFLKKQLDIPNDVIVLLAVVQKWNDFKDYETIEKSLRYLSGYARLQKRKVLFLNLGAEVDIEGSISGIPMRKISYIADPKKIASFYQVADIFLQASHADNFPTTVLEALACGTPVIATAVGGIPEQIEEGKTGFLIPRKDYEAMSTRIITLIEDDTLRNQMSKNAVDISQRRFGLDLMLDEYLTWYQQIMVDWQTNKPLREDAKSINS